MEKEAMIMLKLQNSLGGKTLVNDFQFRLSVYGRANEKLGNDIRIQIELLTSKVRR